MPFRIATSISRRPAEPATNSCKIKEPTRHNTSTVPGVHVSALLSQSLKTSICLLCFPDYPFPWRTNTKAGGTPDPVKPRQGI